ncbi:MAG TPA: hypothetical protein VMV72_01515 [Verrucomicrobiae bacterium]|nr:hypothetical protein [Verrucomicrobiae bacterium]
MNTELAVLAGFFDDAGEAGDPDGGERPAKSDVQEEMDAQGWGF